MTQENQVSNCCDMSSGASRCRIEALVSIDERGQMVLPKDLREKAHIRPGDKLALTSWEKEGSICCITITKAEDLIEMVKSAIGPVVNDIVKHI